MCFDNTGPQCNIILGPLQLRYLTEPSDISVTMGWLSMSVDGSFFSFLSYCESMGGL